MKLKQRSLMATGGAAVLLLVAFQTNCFGLLGVTSPLVRHKIRPRSGDVAANALRAAEDPDIRAHISIMRKDLDLSAYVSLETDTQNLTDSRLLELVLEDTKMQKKGVVDRIIRVAHLLESYKNGLKPNINTYDAHNSQGDDSNVAGTVSSVKGNRSPETLAPRVIQRLDKIVSAMENKHQRVPMHKAPRLDIHNTVSQEGSRLPAWKTFHNHISQYSLYDPKDPAIDEMLQDLVSQPIVKVYQHEGGTQLKLVFYLANNARVMWKPRRFPRDRGTLPDHFYFNDYERFNAEIAAFHLDRILGFYRVTPTAGKLLNMTHDILRLADKKLAKTFYISPAGNVCFYGQCSYYCDTNHALCGRPDMLEGSMAAFLPGSLTVKRKKWLHPWKRSYSKHRLAAWRTDTTYCDKVRQKPPYNTGRRLLDLTDLAVFDFFTGNLDRHHYETFLGFGNFTSLLHLDNGRGFGKPHYDDLTILAPVTQCCLIRYSTLRRLLGFLRSQTTLAQRMRQSMARDKLAPILTEPHLTALNRRLIVVLQVVYNCTTKRRTRDVIVDDGF
ncbi:hypothetical protein NP493_101g01004 [Ridgeia piscesae]|uniref:FAM20 C-terminal domain-containing protein n=1 Tax=Ridgeia piscesae TaxID=27915 RepID=A0AAD9UHI5_RIDPI|nr:hypothetical protein NP493_101g01004 [Ridgeia piscesae]